MVVFGLLHYKIVVRIVLPNLVQYKMFCVSINCSGDGKKFYNGEEVKDKNLVVLNKVFAKDKAAAYYLDEAIEGADPVSFTAVVEVYAKDKNRVYYCRQQRESQTYYTTKKTTINVVHGADAASFEGMDAGYGKDKKQAFFEGEAFRIEDIKSFRILSLYFSADNSKAYFHGQPVPGSHGRSF